MKKNYQIRCRSFKGNIEYEKDFETYSDCILAYNEIEERYKNGYIYLYHKVNGQYYTMLENNGQYTTIY